MSLKAWILPTAKKSLLKQLSIPQIATSFSQLEGILPNGAYTTLRTYDRTQALHLAAHFRRLEESAALAGTDISLDRMQLRAALRQIASQSTGDLRLRIVLDLSLQPGTLYIAAQALVTPPPEAYRQGVKAQTTRLVQRSLPKAKLTVFIHQAAQLQRELPSDIHEAILVNSDGELLEGLSSNFFAVLDGVLHTAGESVLSGTTRALVIDEARQNELPMRIQGINIQAIPRVSEAFITSASRAVLPLCQIDDCLIGSPGPVTRRLMTAYHARVAADIEPI